MPESYEIVERLREIASSATDCASDRRDHGMAAQAEAYLRDARTFREAASLIQSLGEAIKPFAEAAEHWHEMGDTRWIGPDCEISVGDLRRARSALELLKGDRG